MNASFYLSLSPTSRPSIYPFFYLSVHMSSTSSNKFTEIAVFQHLGPTLAFSDVGQSLMSLSDMTDLPVRPDMMFYLLHTFYF